MGANIGTTVTAQIVSFKVTKFIFPAIGLGALLNFLVSAKLINILTSHLWFRYFISRHECHVRKYAPFNRFTCFLEAMIKFGKTRF